MSGGYDITNCLNRRKADVDDRIFYPPAHISAETIINGLTRGVVYYTTINWCVPSISITIRNTYCREIPTQTAVAFKISIAK